ncbi:FSH1-domain-containing protein, partial [Aureobasidium melanogenum]
MPPNSKSTNPQSRKLKILMLHGYTQSGPLFQAKTQRIKKLLEKSLASLPIKTDTPITGIDLFYPTGPFKVSSADLNGAEVRQDANGWWKLRDRGEIQEGVDVGLDQVAKVLKENGPMDGVMGFSQGAALAAMVVSLLEPNRADAFGRVPGGGMEYPQSIKELQHPPLRFGVCFSGLLNKHHAYTAFYEPRIQTPVLHVLGSMDTIVEESESLALAERCADGGDGTVIRHAGTHTVPTSDRDIAAVIQFIRNAFPSGGASANKDEEEDVLDMDMPF